MTGTIINICLAVHHLPLIICRYCGPLVLQDSELKGSLHQYGLYKLIDNISSRFIHSGILICSQKSQNVTHQL